MRDLERQLLEFLVTEHMISPDQYATARNVTDGSHSAILRHLVSGGIITDDQLTLAYGKAFNKEVVTQPVTISPSQAALEKMDEKRAHALNAVPLNYDMNTDILYVAVTPDRYGDISKRDDVRRVSSVKEVRFSLISTANLAKAWKKVYRAEALVNKITKSLNNDVQQEMERRQALAAASQKEQDVVEVAEETDVKRVVTLLLRQAISDGASDVHLEPDGKTLVARQRVDGILKALNVNIPGAVVKNISSVIKQMAGIDISRKGETHDGALHVTDNYGRTVDVRVSIIPCIYGEDIVMRINDNSLATADLEDLGFSSINYERFMDAVTKPYGMVLVTGPTGSGKSTTLYAALNKVYSPEKKIITIENPVEYKFDGIMQIQVNREKSDDEKRSSRSLTFNSVLPDILRHDPDIILVGETRDRETAQISMDAAMTGHLLLTTLHTNNAASAVIRLKEMGVEPYLVGSVTEAVLAQRLLRRLCANCKEEYVPTDTEMHATGLWKGDQDHGITLYRARKGGCDECKHDGYKGRVAVHEVLIVDETIENMIVAEATSTEIQAQAEKMGMISLREDGWAKVRQGTTSMAEVLRVLS